MSISKAQATIDLQKLQSALIQVLTDGKSVSVQTSAGMRSITRSNSTEIREEIDRLERIVNSPDIVSRKGRHDFALANWDHGAPE